MKSKNIKMNVHINDRNVKHSCPIDFPILLRPYWHCVSTSPTPIQAAWILYYEDKIIRYKR